MATPVEEREFSGSEIPRAGFDERAVLVREAIEAGDAAQVNELLGISGETKDSTAEVSKTMDAADSKETTTAETSAAHAASGFRSPRVAPRFSVDANAHVNTGTEEADASRPDTQPELKQVETPEITASDVESFSPYEAAMELFDRIQASMGEAEILYLFKEQGSPESKLGRVFLESKSDVEALTPESSQADIEKAMESYMKAAAEIGVDIAAVMAGAKVAPESEQDASPEAEVVDRAPQGDDDVPDERDTVPGKWPEGDTPGTGAEIPALGKLNIVDLEEVPEQSNAKKIMAKENVTTPAVENFFDTATLEALAQEQQHIKEGDTFTLSELIERAQSILNEKYDGTSAPEKPHTNEVMAKAA